MTAIFINVSAQVEKFNKYNGTYDSLEIINKPKLDSLLANTHAMASLVAIYTNFCIGTHYLLTDIQNYIATHGEKLNIILVSSEPYKEIEDLKKVLRKYSIKLPKTYIIDSDIYKDKRSDSRRKGFEFRNDYCRECRPDIIGVPYCLLYKNGHDLVFHGYKSRINFDSLLNRTINP
jgi:hypothetical protein